MQKRPAITGHWPLFFLSPERKKIILGQNKKIGLFPSPWPGENFFLGDAGGNVFLNILLKFS